MQAIYLNFEFLHHSQPKLVLQIFRIVADVDKCIEDSADLEAEVWS